MVELIGDNCMPRTLVIPVDSVNPPTIKGQITLSGSAIQWYDGGAIRTLSGSNTGD